MPLQTDQSTDLGIVSTPTVCAQRAHLAAQHIRTTFTLFDPTGFALTELTDEYDAPMMGEVCTVSTLAQDDYDFTDGKFSFESTDTEVDILASEAGPRPLAVRALSKTPWRGVIPGLGSIRAREKFRSLLRAHRNPFSGLIDKHR